jgi:hypothetical protein
MGEIASLRLLLAIYRMEHAHSILPGTPLLR